MSQNQNDKHMGTLRLFFSLPTEEWSDFPLLSFFFPFFLLGRVLSMSYAQLLVVRYSPGARERMGPHPSIGGRFIFFAQTSCRVGFCESKLGETMRRLNKKREGKVPARGWLGLKMEFLGWLLWERTRAAVGWEGTGWGEKWDFKKYCSNKESELLWNFFWLLDGVFFVCHSVRKIILHSRLHVSV